MVCFERSPPKRCLSTLTPFRTTPGSLGSSVLDPIGSARSAARTILDPPRAEPNDLGQPILGDVPEGDTIHRTAAALRDALGAGPITSFGAPGVPGPHPQPGESIDAVDARGKHLLIRSAGGVTLHTHLGMSGSWRIGSAAHAPRPQVALGRPGVAARITTPIAVATCRSASVVELLDDPTLARHPVLTSLGPDLCLPDPDLDEIALRLDTFVDPAAGIGVALLDQRPASGIGNVYRSEVLWACRLHPATPLANVDGETRRKLYATANRQLRANLGGGPRRTYEGGIAVYRRAGRPCRRCGTPITSRRLGEQARSAWWCPTCQVIGRTEISARLGGDEAVKRV